MSSSLSVCGLYSSDTLIQTISQILGEVALPEAVAVTYRLNGFTSEESFLQFVQQKNCSIDCLILEERPKLQSVLDQLSQQSIFFPTVFLKGASIPAVVAHNHEDWSYHAATICLLPNQLNQIGFVIDQAIAQFIQLSPVRQPVVTTRIPATPLRSQQLRLSEKLKERLGYLGVYYKRDPQNFLRHMSQPDREELLRHLKAEYCEIVLTYFSDPSALNARLDNFVNVAFFADVSVAQVVEVHMNLMDEFSKQLKLEGRNDDILQDYRLTLIEAIAHLCEMYRRSIPRES
ncbi:MAG: circadian clock protein KaiA [Timaviella obliquedivisa GSE-PSE-MK23-08B]|nr:circadian clock protein KaiA [Timaviella obliquedivisa GSE-PSE-MK23-08B]